MELTSREIRALRAMPEFKTALEQIEAEDLDAMLEQNREHIELHTPCPGGKVSTRADGKYVCDLCGTTSWGTNDNERYLLGKQHWIHKLGGNYAREDGLSGKSAQAADGDWYGSH